MQMPFRMRERAHFVEKEKDVLTQVSRSSASVADRPGPSNHFDHIGTCHQGP